MKTIAVLMTVMLAFALALPIIVAEEDTVVDEVISTEVEIEDAGITPDSPLYGLERAMERLNLAFTFKKVKKAELRLKYAEERLAEAEEMLAEGQLEEATEAQEAHDELLDETQEELEELEVENETTVEDFEDAVKLKLKVESHSEKVSLVKNRILERMRTSNMSQEQVAHLEQVFEKIMNKSRATELRFEENKDRVRLRYKVASEKGDEELAELELELEIENESEEDDSEDEELEVEAEDNESEDEAEGTQGQVQAGQ